MKTIALTFTFSSLCMGILFFAYQANEPQKPKWNMQSRAVAVALGATNRSILQQTNDAATSSETNTRNSDVESMGRVNDLR